MTAFRPMGRPTGFLEIERRDRPYEKPDVRRRSWKEFVKPLPEGETRRQAARCMDCGIPFCHEGCPVNNLIPDWNNLVYRDQWQAALKTLHSTNNFPEFTGRDLPGAVRGVLHAQHRRQSGHDQDDRMRDRRPRLAGGLDRAGRSRRGGPANGSPWSARAPRGSLARSNWRAPVTR